MKDITAEKFTLRDIVNYGLHFIKSEYKGLIPILIVFYFPFGIITALFDMNTNGLQDLTPNHILSFVLMTILLSPLGTMSLTKFMKHRIDNESVPFHELSDYMISRFLPTIFTFSLLILICFPLFFLLIIPGVVVFIYLSFVIQIITLNKFSITETFHHSYNLVRNHWWFVFTLTLFSMTISMIILRMTSAVFNLLNTGITATIFYYLFSQIISLVMNIFTTTLFFNLEKNYSNTSST